MGTSIASPGTSSPAPPAADFAHALRFVLQPDETLVWAERPRGSMWPATWVGVASWLILLAMGAAGGFALAKALSVPPPAPPANNFVIVFFVLWEIVCAIAIWWFATRLTHSIYALTNRRLLSIDTRAPFGALYFGAQDHPLPTRWIQLRGRADAPTIVISKGLIGQTKGTGEFPGIAQPREVAELVRHTLGIKEVEDCTR